ncbi:hypothetical protein L4C33_10590 [Vibrio makurazakiensis]|uniref:cadherin-like domain-containing protein n=1 Tax=Vibrio makurazakiensis TaxID=2910250 RepID=UPI003D0BCA88
MLSNTIKLCIHTTKRFLIMGLGLYSTLAFADPVTIDGYTTPSSGYYSKDEVIKFEVLYSEPMFAYGRREDIYIPIVIGSSHKKATLSSVGGTNRLTFEYKLQSGDQDSDGIYHQGQVTLSGGAYLLSYPKTSLPTTQKFSRPETLSNVIVDTVEPTLGLISTVPDFTAISEPNIRIKTSKKGVFSMTGDCAIKHSSLASEGINQLTLTQTDGSSFSDGIYNNCTIQLEDNFGNLSNLISLPEFEIDGAIPNFNTLTTQIRSDEKNAIDVVVNASKSATISIIALPKSAPSPTVEQVISGVDGHGNAAEISTTFDVEKLVDTTYIFGGLRYHTNYDIYLALTDKFGLTNAVPELQQVNIDINNSNSLTAGPKVQEPIGIPLSADSAAERIEIFDFVVNDDPSDGVDLTIAEVRIYSTNNSAELNQLKFTLETPDGSEFGGKIISTDGNTKPSDDFISELIFTLPVNRNIAIENGTNAQFVVSAYIKDGEVTTPNTVYNLQILGGWGFTLGVGQTMSGHITNGTGSVIQFPELREVTPVEQYSTDVTPSLAIFTSSAGDIHFTGDCNHQVSVPTSGTHTYSLAPSGTSFNDGIYSCTANFIEASGIVVPGVELTPFTIDTAAPTLNTDATPSIEPNDAFSLQLTAVDEYTPAFGLLYTLLSSPQEGSLLLNSSALSSGMTWTQEDITNGALTYQHHGGISTTDTFSFSLEDGLSNTLPTQTFTIDVMQDGDNDGLRDQWEIGHGLNPNDPDDATSDPDQDGCDNLCEFNGGTNPNADEFPPIFDDVNNDYHIQINANSMYTMVIAKTLVAVDEGGQEVTVQGVTSDVPKTGAVLHLRPGRYVYSYTAKDPSGNESFATQVIDIYPTIELAEKVATTEGNQVSLEVALNGKLPCHNNECEISISLVNQPLEDTATYGEDYALTRCSDSQNNSFPTDVTLSPQHNVSSLEFDICSDNIAESNERFTIKLNGALNPLSSEDLPLNLGGLNSQTFVITEQNLPPVMTIRSSDGDGDSKQSFESTSQVSIIADFFDPNKDSLQIEWELPVELAHLSPDQSAENSSITFSASQLDAGDYSFVVLLDDGEFQTKASLMINIMAENVSMDPNADSDGDGINDDQEGMIDADQDGIPDYLDHSEAAKNQMSQDVGDDTRYTMESMTGTQLKLGNSAKSQGNSGPLLNTEDLEVLEVPQPDGVNVGGIFDFEIHQLKTEGQSTSLVIPLREPMLEDGQYTKYKPDLGWVVFVEDENNYISGAVGYDGYCPPPSSEDYLEVDGITPRTLQAGDWCLKITIEDGGPNDDDGIANKSIVDPGGIIVHNYVEPEIPPSVPESNQPSSEGSDSGSLGSGSSGGSLPISALIGLFMLVIVRNRYR